MVDDQELSSAILSMKHASNVRNIDIQSLSLWEQNYRLGDVEAIKNSIRRFGFGSVIRVWNGTVMAGNHALKAVLELKSEGWNPTGAITIKGESWFIPVLDISHLSEQEAQAFAIADNRTQELGENDDNALSKLLLELQSSSLLTETGYDDSDLDELLATLEQENAIAIVNGQESTEWVGMPEFTPTVKPYDVMIHCETEDHQKELSAKIVQVLNIDLALRGDTYVGYFPNKDRAKTSGMVIDLNEETYDQAA